MTDMTSSPLDLTSFNSLLSDEERMLQEAMADFANKSLKPNAVSYTHLRAHET